MAARSSRLRRLIGRCKNVSYYFLVPSRRKWLNLEGAHRRALPMSIPGACPPHVRNRWSLGSMKNVVLDAGLAPRSCVLLLLLVGWPLCKAKTARVLPTSRNPGGGTCARTCGFARGFACGFWYPEIVAPWSTVCPKIVVPVCATLTQQHAGYENRRWIVGQIVGVRVPP